jgi:two-component sensor histidine kinase
MDLCLEVGLILTELASNACRHGEIPSHGGLIRISLRKEEAGILLTVADDGPGFPEGFLLEAVKTVGFKIIGSLVKQRKGTVVAFNHSGAVVQVRLPWPEEAPPMAITA